MTTAPTPDLAIDLHSVFKTYGRRVQALQGVDLRVRRGEVFGLLGPNGAGKSTLVKIIMTVVRPTRADGNVLGRPVGHKPTLARVGYLPENHRFPKYLTGRQVLDFFAALAKVDRATRRKRGGELLDIVGMTQWADTKIATYSKGMLQRVGLAQALVHDPDLVMLDEPTDGVDPVGRRDILDILNRIRGQGRTVFVNSHALSELESICDRVAILVKGRVAKQGTLDELTVARQRYEIDVAAAEDPASLRQRIRAAVPVSWSNGSELAAPRAPLAASLSPVNQAGPVPLPIPPQGLPAVPLDRGALANGLPIELYGLTLRVQTIDPAAVQGAIDGLRSAGLVVRRVEFVRPSLEDLFMEAVIDPTTGSRSTPGAAIGPATRETPL